MHGLPTLQYLNDAKHGEGAATAKKIIAEVFGVDSTEKELPQPVAAPAVDAE
jgi:hypothetical protein